MKRDTTTPETAEATEIVSEVWKNLPEELLAPILAHLPWWSKLRLQVVCKTWKSLLHDPELLGKFCPPSRPRLPCCIARTSRGAAIFNLTLMTWHLVPPSWLKSPETRHSANAAQDNDCNEGSSHQIAAAAGGLFLLESRDEKLGRFLVNPLNKSRRRLPDLPAPEQGYRSTCTILGMVADETSRTLKIIAEQTEVEEADVSLVIESGPQARLGATKFCEVYIYDMKSESPSWEMATTLQSEIDMCLEIENAVLVGNDLYILMVQPFGWCWMYRVFRAEVASWKEVDTDIAFDLGHVQLFEHRESLMLVGGTDVMKGDRALSVDIWRLNMESDDWEIVLTMPKELIRKLYVLPENGIFFHFGVEGDYACFVNSFTETTITCDLVNKAWGMIDRNQHREDFQFVDDVIFLFHPKLDVLL